MTVKPDYREKDTVVIGVGTTYRSDDRVGFEVVDRLKEKGTEKNVRYRKTSDPMSVFSDLKGSDTTVIIVDSVRSEEAGHVVYFQNPDLKKLRNSSSFYSSHNVGIMEGIRLAKALQIEFHEIRIYGIPGYDYSYGESLSARTEEQVSEVVNEIHTFLEEIKRET